ncbi:hypothetical protein ALC53_13693 [Atta colombica]|uniref:Uncharacterized protein n=1 Tax=Atta colombica TaxID=520822 RepID=A0A195AUD1_9HYME|nr:hypothetical protein ALC53_13693 [Atta colombica]
MEAVGKGSRRHASRACCFDEETRDEDKRKSGYWVERERTKEGKWIVREGKGVREREKQSMRGRERKIVLVASSRSHRMRSEYRANNPIRFSTILRSFN